MLNKQLNGQLNSENEFLISFGWDEFFEKQIPENKSLVPARVIGEERQLYRVQFDFDEVALAIVTGKFKFNTESRVHFPAVGDWVWVERPRDASRVLIHQVCQRKTMIHRKQIGSGSDSQILAANIDTIFVTTSLNDDLNFRRIERYLSMAYESGATPVILLTKADVYREDLIQLLTHVKQQFLGVDVYALSQNNFEQADFFQRLICCGQTAVVVGSSGVGKSTLINYLIDIDNCKEKIKTQDIRDDDSKGRHTTTSRNLYVSRFGGLVIDTPGMRELQLADHGEGVSQHFSDIENLFLQCRFTDCQHQSEPGCAVTEAFNDGSLQPERWQNYLKLQAEVRYGQRRQDKKLAAEEKKRWKKLTVEGQQRGRAKRGDY